MFANCSLSTTPWQSTELQSSWYSANKALVCMNIIRQNPEGRHIQSGYQIKSNQSLFYEQVGNTAYT